MDDHFSETLQNLGIELFWADVDDLTPREESQIRAMMSEDERRRARRFRHEPSRRCHLVTRRLVRTTLSELGDRPPDRWQFGRSEQGRPFLKNPTPSLEKLDFNIAHSRQKVVLATVVSADVGVDLEPEHRRVDHELVANRFFHPSECKEIEAMEGPRRRLRFLKLWVLKEAWMKADGRGIGAGLSRVVFSFDDRGRPRLQELPDGHRRSRWTVAMGRVDDHLVAVAHRAEG